ncbi:hypothetical protein HanPSC8_Chr10g0412381 [Helianthus annuus]|nr:hypothetical protein HanPSC8_Chr10g0412381 [Helianthus annuus]
MKLQHTTKICILWYIYIHIYLYMCERAHACVITENNMKEERNTLTIQSMQETGCDPIPVFV